MKHTLLAGIAAIALIAGSGLASAQTTSPAASPQAQPNTQTRDQEGTPGTGMSSPAPAQPRAGATTVAPSAPPPATMGQGSSGQAHQGGTASPATSADTRDRDQEGTPGTGKSAPAAGGSPRQ
jgi:hypothetical protein